MLFAVRGSTGERVQSVDVHPASVPVGHGDPGERGHDPVEVELRRACAAGEIVCPEEECGATLRFKRGLRVIAHFAHPPSELTCRHARKDNALLVAAQTALCWWLKGKVDASGDRLTGWRDRVAVGVATTLGEQPIDCQLAAPAGGRSFHYLLLRKRLGWDARSAWDAFRRAGNRLVRLGIDRRFVAWRGGVKLEPDQRLADDEEVRVELSPQEGWMVEPLEQARPFFLPEAADVCYDGFGAGARTPGAGSSYLVPAVKAPSGLPSDWKVVSLRLARRPRTDDREARAFVLVTPLPEMRIRPSDGRPLHPGEHERFRAWEDRMAEGVAEHQRRLDAQEEAMKAARRDSLERRVGLTAPPPVSSPSPRDKPARCLLCGEMTSDWWMHDPATGTCKCHACLCR